MSLHELVPVIFQLVIKADIIYIHQLRMIIIDIVLFALCKNLYSQSLKSRLEPFYVNSNPQWLSSILYYKRFMCWYRLLGHHQSQLHWLGMWLSRECIKDYNKNWSGSVSTNATVNRDYIDWGCRSWGQGEWVCDIDV